MAAEFRALLKSYRLRAGYGLRQFAELIGDAPSNYANIEAGAREPWRSMEKLRLVADTLSLEEGSRDWDAFYIAAREAGVLPPDMQHLLERPAVMVLLRTVDEQQLSEADLRKVADYIRKKYKGAKRDSERPD